MSFSPAEKLLLACARVRRDEARIDSLLKEKIDWECLLKLAKVHQITPLLWHNLRRHKIPEEIRSKLKEAYQANLIRNLRLEAEQNKIFKLLGEHGIDFVPLKGTVFAELIYGDIALRQSSDIDVLVREKELFKAKELLLNHGFKRTGFSDEYYLKDSCHLVFSNGRVLLEVHWHIEPTNTAHVPSGFVWREVYPRKIGNKETKMFSSEMLLVFFVQKFNFDSFNCLKYLIDLAEIIQRYREEIEWKKVDELLRIYRVKNVSFSYNGKEEVLENVSFSIKPGEHMAVVGPSGVGKTTLISLMLGFYFPTKGEILFDGMLVSNFAVDSLRKRIGYVSQSTRLLTGTILENLRYGNRNASEETVIAASKAAGIHDFINGLPDKYQSLLGENGVNLSEGQRQRLSIARALIKDPDILILDEPSSSLDSFSEKSIFEALPGAIRNKTLIIVAHRLSTIKEADRILVFNEKRLIAEGTHETLSKGNEFYRSLMYFPIENVKI